MNASTIEVLSLNAGSSSLKAALYAFTRNNHGDLPVLRLSASAEKMHTPSPHLKVTRPDGTTVCDEQVKGFQSEELPDHLLEKISHQIMQECSKSPDVIAHRIVHGGAELTDHCQWSPAIERQLQNAIHFAPLHIPPALELLDCARSRFPNARQVLCFDTAFHQDLPPVAATLAIPEKYRKEGIRKYGFHGISYASIVDQLRMEQALPERLVIAHLGSGASLCAVRSGVSVDTSMGLTPTGGILMGTRSGDVDPGVLFYMARKYQLKTDDLESIFNHDCGLTAIGGEADVQTLLSSSNKNAKLALEKFVIDVTKVIATYAVTLGGIDRVIFTGGVGEHAQAITNQVIEMSSAIGLNASQFSVRKTQEELHMAKISFNLL